MKPEGGNSRAKSGIHAFELLWIASQDNEVERMILLKGTRWSWSALIPFIWFAKVLWYTSAKSYLSRIFSPNLFLQIPATDKLYKFDLVAIILICQYYGLWPVYPSTIFAFHGWSSKTWLHQKNKRQPLLVRHRLSNQHHRSVLYYIVNGDEKLCRYVNFKNRKEWFHSNTKATCRAKADVVHLVGLLHLEIAGWEVISHSPCSLDLAPSLPLCIEQPSMNFL